MLRPRKPGQREGEAHDGCSDHPEGDGGCGRSRARGDGRAGVAAWGTATSRPYPRALRRRGTRPPHPGGDRTGRRPGDLVLLRPALHPEPRAARDVPRGHGHPAGPAAEGSSHRGGASGRRPGAHRVSGEPRQGAPQVRHPLRPLPGRRRGPHRCARPLRDDELGRGDRGGLGPYVHDDLPDHDRRGGGGRTLGARLVAGRGGLSRSAHPGHRRRHAPDRPAVPLSRGAVHDARDPVVATDMAPLLLRVGAPARRAALPARQGGAHAAGCPTPWSIGRARGTC